MVHKNLDNKLKDDIYFEACLTNPDTYMNSIAKVVGFKYYEYISTYAYFRMNIRNDFHNIIKGLDQIYTLEGVKGIFYEKR